MNEGVHIVSAHDPHKKDFVPPNNISKANIKNENLNNNELSFHNKSNSSIKFNDISNKEFKGALNNNFNSNQISKNNEILPNTISEKNIDQKEVQSDNNNATIYNENNGMIYDLDSLICFLILYRKNIPNYDNAILILIILNYYIRFFLLPTTFEKSNSKEEYYDIDLGEPDVNLSIDRGVELEEYQNVNSKLDNDHINNKQEVESNLELKENTQLNYRKKINFATIKNKHLTDKNSIHNYIYSLTSTISQVQLTNNIKMAEFNASTGSSFDISPITEEIKKRVPVLIASFNVDDIFKGDLIFNNFIIDINNISNMIYINDATLIVDIKDNVYLGTVFLEGYLKTTADALIPVQHSVNTLSSMYRNNMICTPFSLAQTIGLDPNYFQHPMAYNNLQIDITKVSSNTKRILKESKKINNYFEFYNRCELIIEINYTLNIYKPEDILI